MDEIHDLLSTSFMELEEIASVGACDRLGVLGSLRKVLQLLRPKGPFAQTYQLEQHLRRAARRFLFTLSLPYTDKQPKAMSSFNEGAFRTKVGLALERVKTLLNNTRTLLLAEDVRHRYEDKYALVEAQVNTSIRALVLALEAIGVTKDNLEQMCDWSRKRSVTMRFASSDHEFKFLRKVEREIKFDTEHVHKSTFFGTSKSFTVTKVTEYFWQYEATYTLTAHQGNHTDKAITIASRTGSIEVKTSAYMGQAAKVYDIADVNLTWLFAALNPTTGEGRFAIDRSAPTCRTPRRNAQVNDFMALVHNFATWQAQVDECFTRLQRTDTERDMTVPRKAGADVFLPVGPIFEQNTERPLLSAVTVNALLTEQQRQIREVFANLDKVFLASSASKLISVREAKLVAMCTHMTGVLVATAWGIDYVELMLRKQLIAAIGKEVQTGDFNNYQRYHNMKLFRDGFQPRPFAYSIRRPAHSPEGIISIVEDLNDTIEPVPSFVHRTIAAQPMKFAINAATDVSFLGERYLHGIIRQQVQGSSAPLLLNARARAFSSYIVLLGTIISKDVFEPKHAIIVQNKDDLRIPLNMETIPSAKAFKDAIDSLSPEQQRFAKAYRTMQLGATLFGVCIIQIKPQLEKLLRLEQDSLTKEIELTQRILNLFTEYQIPPDLISSTPDAQDIFVNSVEQLAEFVWAIESVIEKHKQAQLVETQQARNQREAQKLIPTSARRGLRKQALQDQRRAEQEKLIQDKCMEFEASMAYIFNDLRSLVQEQNEMLDSIECNIEYARNQTESANLELQPAEMYQSKRGLLGRVASSLGSGASSLSIPSPSSGKKSMEAARSPGKASLPVTEDSRVDPHVSTREGKQGGRDSTKAVEQPSATNETKLVMPTPPPRKEEAVTVDFTRIPRVLESKFEELDTEGSVRPTIISAGNTWQRLARKSMLADEGKQSLEIEQQQKERTKAFDLLDSLTSSGALVIDQAELHIILASTHCFDQSIMDTVIQANINPIDKVERTSLIVACAIHGCDPAELVRPEQAERIASHSPALIMM